MNIESIKSIYLELIEEKKILPFLSTFVLSQDQLENLFGQVRSHLGFNDNPTSIEFSAAYRKILAIGQIMVSNHSNCQDIITRNVYTNILMVSSQKAPNVVAINNENIDELLDRETNKIYEYRQRIKNNDHLLESLSHSSIAFLASKIEEIMVNSSFYCTECKNIFAENDKIDESFVNSQNIRKPCKSTFTICKIIDNLLEANKHKLFDESFNFNLIYYLVFKEIGEQNIYSKSDFSTHSEHKYFVIRCIVDKYTEIKATDIARCTTLELQPKYSRHNLHKTMHRTGV